MPTTISMLAIDLAKGSFQVCAIGADGAVLYNRLLSRTRLMTLLAEQPACIVTMDACATSHHWARVALSRGHEVRLVPAAYVKPFVKRQKNDKADAEAIEEAASRPTMRFVAVKSAETQGRAVAFRTHQCLVRQRTQLINALRGQASPTSAHISLNTSFSARMGSGVVGLERAVKVGGHLDGSSVDGLSRLEVIEGPTGRRRRTKAERARIAAESLMPGASVIDVARRHGTTRWKANDWRKKLRDGRLVVSESVAALPMFAELVVPWRLFQRPVSSVILELAPLEFSNNISIGTV